MSMPKPKDALAKFRHCGCLIPTRADPHALAQSRRPMDMMIQGWSMRRFHAGILGSRSDATLVVAITISGIGEHARALTVAHICRRPLAGMTRKPELVSLDAPRSGLVLWPPLPPAHAHHADVGRQRRREPARCGRGLAPDLHLPALDDTGCDPRRGSARAAARASVRTH